MIDTFSTFTILTSGSSKYGSYQSHKSAGGCVYLQKKNRFHVKISLTNGKEAGRRDFKVKYLMR